MRIFSTIALSFLWGGMMCAQDIIPLPAPEASVLSKPLSEVLQNRRSVRTYAPRQLSDRDLSALLWAACGVNRAEEGRITAPSAINAQDITVYVCREDGTFRYVPGPHQLVKVNGKDLRKAIAGRQEFAATAPVSLLLVSDLSKFHTPRQEMGAMDAGYVSENICLACTAMGLATVPRMTMEHERLVEELGLGENEVPMLNHPVGYMEE